MKLRLASALLWFLAGWFGVGSIAFHVGLNPAIGLLVGLAWAALIVIDPKDVVWRVGKRSTTVKQELSSHGAAPRSQIASH
jgi:hypothetical protein